MTDKINEYLDDARFNSRCRTDAELSEKLGIPGSYLSNLRAGKSFPGADIILVMAELGGHNPLDVLIELSKEKLSKQGSDYAKKRINLLEETFNKPDNDKKNIAA